MTVEVKQVDSLQKVFGNELPKREASNKNLLLKGERFRYQIAVKTDYRTWYRVKVASKLRDCIKLFRVEDAIMDMAVGANTKSENFITCENGAMPDILIPIDETTVVTAREGTSAVWVEVDIPKNFPCGDYSVEIEITTCNAFSLGMKDDKFESLTFACHSDFTVLDKELSDKHLTYTQWMYLDCIASAHDVEIFSEKHWYFIEKYIEAAADCGINMILTPVHTPPLDTSKGIYRDDVSLMDISYNEAENKYTFRSERLERFIEICLKQKIEYFEIAHLFSQWGSEFAAPIKVDGAYKFGWHTKADDAEYFDFLKQYISAIVEVFKKFKLEDRLYFHISDEPSIEKIEKYKAAYNLMKPLLGDIKTLDALSEYDFYEQGLINTPVTVTGNIAEFLKHDVPDQWAYYCSSMYAEESNRFMSMPSYRNRVIGLQMFKYDIKGFLHWGFNFYNSCCSVEKINPYITTSANKVFPSGDSFSVYPARNGVYQSIRSMVFHDALQDMRILETLAEYIGREAVTDMLEKSAGSEITFDSYPHDDAFILNVIAKAKEIIAEAVNK